MEVENCRLWMDFPKNVVCRQSLVRLVDKPLNVCHCDRRSDPLPLRETEKNAQLKKYQQQID